MRRAGLVAIAALCALPAAHGHELTLAPHVIHALTPIDSIPTKEELQFVFPTGTLSELVQIAEAPGVDFGVRLRAIRALPQFCPPAACEGTLAHTTLVALIEGIELSDHSGQTLLVLRAAIEALGVARSGDPDDVTLLVPFLDNASRDLRAATARALRDLCNPQAIVPLRTRYLNEEVAQVRIAISAALRDLGQCSP